MRPPGGYRRSYSPRDAEHRRRREAEAPLRRAQEAERELARQKAMNREAQRLGVRPPYPKAGT